MNLITKTAILVTAIGLSQAAIARPAQIDTSGCWEEYRACLAAGYDADMCRDNYWLCRYGYIPVKAMVAAAIDDRAR
ncbi:MAG: hypothetical protein JF600_04930 [Xanthomonadales bacterium]|nr:hypothetical protein [Xanthomonadales bacterium]